MRALKNKGLPKEGTTRDPGLTPRGAPTRDSTTHTVSNRGHTGHCEKRGRAANT